MPDVSGMDILEYAKRKDEYTEVIMMTGYASLDSVTLAVNQGVNSYLVKPLQISEFTIQVEKAVASRLFHLRSIELMRQTDNFSPDVKLHVHEITSLYYFIRKLMLSLEIPEIMRITLDEALCRLDGQLAVIHIAIHGFQELYAMPASAEDDATAIAKFIELHQEQIILPNAGKPEYGMPSPIFFKGRQGAAIDLGNTAPLSVPMMVADRMLGMVTIFVASPPGVHPDRGQYLYVLSSLVSSVIEHGYLALQARRQAKTDSLTGISNHRHFHETLDREISRANRKRGGFTLILLDIDDFKKVNDTYGHQVGDAVLINMTTRISSMIRTGDVFARYGGEEFGLILPDTEPQGAEALATRIIATIASNSFVFSHHSIFYTVSIGLAVYQGALPVEKDSLIAAADKALYTSKENGKNRLSIGTIVV
jgi:diguanylate cyclase (GGDEF)-like protein